MPVASFVATGTALLKLVFSPHREEALRRALAEMAGSLEFSVEPWPLDRA